MSFGEKLVTLRMTAAVVIDGQIVKAKQLVEMVESEAKDLLRRGKAELHAVVDAIEGNAEDAQATDLPPNTLQPAPAKATKKAADAPAPAADAATK